MSYDPYNFKRIGSMKVAIGKYGHYHLSSTRPLGNTCTVQMRSLQHQQSCAALIYSSWSMWCQIMPTSRHTCESFKQQPASHFINTTLLFICFMYYLLQSTWQRNMLPSGRKMSPAFEPVFPQPIRCGPKALVPVMWIRAGICRWGFVI